MRSDLCNHCLLAMAVFVLIAAAFLFLPACIKSQPKSLGIQNNQLSPCPSTENCVCSDAQDGLHHTAEYKLAVEPSIAWQALQKTIASLPRTRIVKATNTYLHAETTSRVFRFVDDVEFHLRPEKNIIAVRSAARIGRFDFGVNRGRIDHIREMLQSLKIIH